MPGGRTSFRGEARSDHGYPVNAQAWLVCAACWGGGGAGGGHRWAGGGDERGCVSRGVGGWALQDLHQQGELRDGELGALRRRSDRVPLHDDQQQLHAGAGHHLRRHGAVDQCPGPAGERGRHRAGLCHPEGIREPGQPATGDAGFRRSLLRGDDRPVRQPDRGRQLQAERADLHAAGQQRAEHAARRVRRLG